MRCPTRIDPATEDADEYQRLYHPTPLEPTVLEVDYIEPDDDEGLVDPAGTPLIERMPFGFQPSRP